MAPFERGGDHAHAKRLGQDQDIPGLRTPFGHDLVWRNDTSYRQTEFWLIVLNCVSPNNGSARRHYPIRTAAQNFREDRRIKVFGKGSQIEGEQHVAAHGVNVTHGIGSRNGTEGIRVIYHRWEEIHR